MMIKILTNSRGHLFIILSITIKFYCVLSFQVMLIHINVIYSLLDNNSRVRITSS